MGQARVGEEGIKARKEKIELWEQQIAVWQGLAEDTPGLRKLREATGLGVTKTRDEILDRVKTLSFATVPDQLDLAKLSGRLDGLESIYYDIADAKKKIEGARTIIAKLADEIKRAKKGELLETRA